MRTKPRRTSRNRFWGALALCSLASLAGLAGPVSVGNATEPEPSLLDEIEPLHELVIVHPRVVDPFLNGGRSHNGGPNETGGEWSFRKLVEDVARDANGGEAPSEAFLDAFLQGFFQPWLGDAEVQGQALPARDANRVTTSFLDLFSAPVDPGDAPSPEQSRHYELWKAPLELIAIVNRMDLRPADGSNGGELRFVYKLVHPDAGDQQFTIILEFKVPLDFWDSPTFSHQWHLLSSMEVGSPEYLEQLGYITNHVTQWRPFYGNPGTAPRLSQVRTNEIVFAPECSGCGEPVWEMREFRPDASGKLVPAPLFNSLPHALNGTQTLADFVACYPELAEFTGSGDDFTIPTRFEECPADPAFAAPGVDLLGVVSHMGPEFDWKIPGPDGAMLDQASSAAVDHLGLLTCNGCHNENKGPGDRSFYHIDPELLTDDLTALRTGTGRLSLFLTEGRGFEGEQSEFMRRAQAQAAALETPSTHLDFATGAQCTSDAACTTTFLGSRNTCQNGLCLAQKHCRDWGVTPGHEGGVDCGGDCRRCFPGEQCRAAVDCLQKPYISTGLDCIEGVCVAPTCTDGHANGKETDVDCGGGVCTPCAFEQRCAVSTDCTSGNCVNGICGDRVHCTDGLFDPATETGLDCGGECRAGCGHTAGCSTSADCAAELVCLIGSCTSNSCGDLTVEDPTQCEGLRRVGMSCTAASDCQSGRCEGGTCTRATACGAPPGWPLNDENDFAAFVASGLTYSWEGECGGVGCDACGEGGFCSTKSGCQFGARCELFDGYEIGSCVAVQFAGESCATRAQCAVGLECSGSECVRP